MADRDGAVAAGPAAPSVADDPADGVAVTTGPSAGAGTAQGTGAAAPVVEQRRAEEPPSFFDQPVRDPDLGPDGADRVVLEASPADVVTGAQAETTELRAALDDLRRVLDDVDAAKVAPRRRRVPVLALTAGVVAVVAAGLLAGGVLSGDDTTGEVTTVASSTASSTAADPSAGATPGPSASTQPQPSTAPPAGFPASGPGVTEPGTTALATVDPRTGDVQVYEQFLAGSPQSALPLHLVQPTALRGDAAAARPALAASIVVLLDSEQARAVPAGDSTWVVAPSTGAKFQRAVLRYTVTGAFVLSKPAARGRGLILFSPVTATDGLQLGYPVRLVTAGPQVNSITCPTLPSAATLCEQTAQGTTRTAVVPPRSPDALMMLSVDLPQAS